MYGLLKQTDFIHIVSITILIKCDGKMCTQLKSVKLKVMLRVT